MDQANCRERLSLVEKTDTETASDTGEGAGRGLDKGSGDIEEEIPPGAPAW